MAPVGIQLVGTGVAMGIVHVLTGPDHLSALATLSANVDCRRAFLMGVRWGVGHSIGLIFVGSILIAISSSSSEDDADVIMVNETITKVLESFVGVFMLCLGAYGFNKAFRNRQDRLSTVAQSQEGRELTEGGSFGDVEKERGGESADGDANGASFRDDPQDVEESGPAYLGERPDGAHERLTRFPCVHRCRTVAENRCSPGVLALCTGIVHGVAGPGGVLGVVPAVQLHDAGLAALYLGTFCVTSVLVMGAFASLYGTLSEKIASSAQVAFQVECASASLSIIVGVLWLSLLSVGKLSDVFP